MGTTATRALDIGWSLVWNLASKLPPLVGKGGWGWLGGGKWFRSNSQDRSFQQSQPGTFSLSHKASSCSFSNANLILSLACLKLSTGPRIKHQDYTRQARSSPASSLSALYLASPFCLTCRSSKPHPPVSHFRTFWTMGLDSSFLPHYCLLWSHPL